MDENTQQPIQAPLRRPVRQIPQQEKRRERIKMWMAVCMVIVALCVDGIQAILTIFGIGLALGPIISVVAYFAFFVWFKILDVSFVGNPKKLLIMGSSGVVEATASFIPTFFIAITSVISITMTEDRGGFLGKVASATQGKIKP